MAEHAQETVPFEYARIREHWGCSRLPSDLVAAKLEKPTRESTATNVEATPTIVLHMAYRDGRVGMKCLIEKWRLC